MSSSQGTRPVAAVLAAWFAVAAVASSAPPVSAAVPDDCAAGLRLNYLEHPRGVDRTRALFTWQLPSHRGMQQTGARVQVRSEGAASGPSVVFDSGYVATDQPSLANAPPMAPLALESDTVYRWTLQLWTAGQPQGPSCVANASFTSGVVSQAEWAAAGARWIRGGTNRTQMRKEFEVPAAAANLSRATLFVAACQYYSLQLDGVRVGEQRLDGPWTEFYTNRSYTTHDIDPSRLAPGKHVLGLRVGQGFCSQPAHDAFDPSAERSAILLLQLHAADGSVAFRVPSDGTWTSSQGPILADSTYYGELFDAREEQPGWAEPGFVPPPGRTWQPVDTNFTVVAHLSSQGMEPIAAVREMPAVSYHRVTVSYNQTPCVANVAENTPATVSCAGSTIESVAFLSFGLPVGSCSAGVRNGTCGTSANLTAAVEAACLGQESCTVQCIGRVPPAAPNGLCTITSQPRGASSKFVEGEPCGPVRKATSMAVTCAPLPPSAPRYKYVYDFGQEFAGVVRLTLPPGTPAGTRATLKHAEALAHEPLATPDGSVYMGNLFWANPVDVYLAKGGGGGSEAGPESYTPEFTYHGFRYVELLLEPPSGGHWDPSGAEPGLESVVGINLRSSVAEPGRVSLGSDAHAPGNLLQRLSNNSWWTEAAALMSIPAGAAGRGERNGWTGDAAFASESECFDFDTGAFFANYLAQVADAQAPNGEVGGGVPDQGTAPTTRHRPQETPMDPSWSAVFPVVAFNLWKYYNCTHCIDSAWTGLTLYYRMLANNYTISPTTPAKWGDWNPAYPRPRTPDGKPGVPFVRTRSSITAAAMVLQNFYEAAEMAAATGRDSDAAHFQALVAGMRQQYHSSFYDALGGVYGDATPTAFATALWLGVTPEPLLPAVVDRFVWQLSSVGYKMDTIGFIGVRYVFEALAKVNRTDVALRMLNVTRYPSFGYQITNTREPATSLWESYDADTMHQWVDESSRDHHYSASINTFLRKYLAGLDQPQGSAAWAVVKCRPEAAFHPTMLPMAAASLDSHRGPIRCSWRASAVPGLPPPPPPPPSQPPPTMCAITPMFTDALRGPSPMVLQCPPGEVVSNVTYAKWGTASPQQPWFCWGPQPPAAGSCETDVSGKIRPLCVGKPACNLSAVATKSVLGGPCTGEEQLIVRVQCNRPADGPFGGEPEIDSAGRAAPVVAPPVHATHVWATVNVTVPGGSRGEVHVPVVNATSGAIEESGAIVWQGGSFVPGAAPGVSAGGFDGRFVWFRTRAGDYSFSSRIG